MPFNRFKSSGRGFALSPNWFQEFFRRYTFLALVALSVIAGIMFGATVAYQASMTEQAQEVAGLANYRPNLVTRVIADDGKTVVGEFSLERRIPVTWEVYAVSLGMLKPYYNSTFSEDGPLATGAKPHCPPR